MASGHDTTTCGGSGICPECSQRATTEAFYSAAGRAVEVTCPHCGLVFERDVPDAPVRTTEVRRAL